MVVLAERPKHAQRDRALHDRAGDARRAESDDERASAARHRVGAQSHADGVGDPAKFDRNDPGMTMSRGTPTNDRAIGSDSYIVSTDSGGTFVDAVILDGSGKLTIGKSPTTPDDPAKGIIAAVGAAAVRAGLDLRTVLGQCAMFLNGTTVTTNAMIQRTGAKTGLIMTRGFEDTLIIGRVRSRWVGLDESALADFKNVERPRSRRSHESSYVACPSASTASAKWWCRSISPRPRRRSTNW